MADIYEEKIDCEFCKNAGVIEVVAFRYTNRISMSFWNKIEGTHDVLCPLCEGRGYLHIIKQKTS